MTAQLMTNTAILEVFVHEDESDDPSVVAEVCRNRARKHARTPTGCSTSPSSSHAGPARASVRDSTTPVHSIPSSAEARGPAQGAGGRSLGRRATSMRVMAR